MRKLDYKTNDDLVIGLDLDEIDDLDWFVEMGRRSLESDDSVDRDGEVVEQFREILQESL